MHEQLGYGYDPVGNLQFRTNNLAQGLTAQVQTFVNNDLNQVENVTRTGTLTVAGRTSVPASSVWINGTTNSVNLYADQSYAKGGFVLVGPSAAFTIVAQDVYGRKETNSATVNLPASVQHLYDQNGNLTSDGLRNFVYDEDNQLTRVELPGNWRTDFVYDGLRRKRIRTTLCERSANILAHALPVLREPGAAKPRPGARWQTLGSPRVAG